MALFQKQKRRITNIEECRLCTEAHISTLTLLSKERSLCVSSTEMKSSIEGRRGYAVCVEDSAVERDWQYWLLVGSFFLERLTSRTETEECVV